MTSKNLPQTLASRLAKLTEISDADYASESTRSVMPRVEVYTDKLKKSGVFTLDYRDGAENKEALGDSVSIIYLSTPDEIRTLFVDDNLTCSARNGIPYTREKHADSCTACVYNSWPDNKLYTDSNRNSCRTKLHIPCELILGEGDDTRLLPVTLVVPPTSIKHARKYHSSFKVKSRATGVKTNPMLVVSKLNLVAHTGVNGYTWSMVNFQDGQLAVDRLTETQKETWVNDSEIWQQERSKAMTAQEAVNDIASSKIAPEIKDEETIFPPEIPVSQQLPKKAKARILKTVDGKEITDPPPPKVGDDELPF